MLREVCLMKVVAESKNVAADWKGNNAITLCDELEKGFMRS